MKEYNLRIDFYQGLNLKESTGFVINIFGKNKFHKKIIRTSSNYNSISYVQLPTLVKQSRYSKGYKINLEDNIFRLLESNDPTNLHLVIQIIINKLKL